MPVTTTRRGLVRAGVDIRDSNAALTGDQRRQKKETRKNTINPSLLTRCAGLRNCGSEIIHFLDD
jgi:hypothetical protein